MPGQNALLRGGFEVREGVPGRNSTYKPFMSETLDMDRPEEQDPNIDASGNETAGQNLKAAGAGKITGAPDSESWLEERISQHGFYDLSAPASGVALYELRDFDELSDDPLGHYVDSLWYGAWRDEETSPSEYNVLGAKVSTFTLSVDANKFVKYEHDLLFTRDRYMRNPTELAVDAAYTGDWVSRGHRPDANTAAPFAAIKITDDGAVGVAKLVYGSGADVTITSVGTVATATSNVPHGFSTGQTVTVYGAVEAGFNVTAVITVISPTTFTYPIADLDDISATGAPVAIRWSVTEHLVVDGWMTVYAPADGFLGTRREPVEIRPTPQAGDVFTVGDIWRINTTSPKPTPVYSQRPRLVGTDMILEFTVGSVTRSRVIESFSLKMGTPREAKPGLGSKYFGRIGQPANAKKWWEASFAQAYLDRELKQALISETGVAAYAKFYGSAIGSTGYEDFSEFTLARMKLSKAGATTTGPGEQKENPVLRAFSVGGSSLCVERHQNTIASVEPT